MDINQLQIESHKYAVDKGFWQHDDHRHTVDAEKIALMHSELSEALQALRDYDWKHVEMELADTIIRIADYAEARHLSLETGIMNVREKAKDRPAMHGHKW